MHLAPKPADFIRDKNPFCLSHVRSPSAAKRDYITLAGPSVRPWWRLWRRHMRRGEADRVISLGAVATLVKLALVCQTSVRPHDDDDKLGKLLIECT